MSAERRYQLSLPDELPDTLLARRMLAELPPIAGAATAARLAVRARAPATRAAEELHWQRFVDFCEAQRVELDIVTLDGSKSTKHMMKMEPVQVIIPKDIENTEGKTRRE